MSFTLLVGVCVLSLCVTIYAQNQEESVLTVEFVERGIAFVNAEGFASVPFTAALPGVRPEFVPSRTLALVNCVAIPNATDPGTPFTVRPQTQFVRFEDSSASNARIDGPFSELGGNFQTVLLAGPSFETLVLPSFSTDRSDWLSNAFLRSIVDASARTISLLGLSDMLTSDYVNLQIFRSSAIQVSHFSHVLCATCMEDILRIDDLDFFSSQRTIYRFSYSVVADNETPVAPYDATVMTELSPDASNQLTLQRPFHYKEMRLALAVDVQFLELPEGTQVLTGVCAFDGMQTSVVVDFAVGLDETRTIALLAHHHGIGSTAANTWNGAFVSVEIEWFYPLKVRCHRGWVFEESSTLATFFVVEFAGEGGAITTPRDVVTAPPPTPAPVGESTLKPKPTTKDMMTSSTTGNAQLSALPLPLIAGVGGGALCLLLACLLVMVLIVQRKRRVPPDTRRLSRRRSVGLMAGGRRHSDLHHVTRTSSFGNLRRNGSRSALKTSFKGNEPRSQYDRFIGAADNYGRAPTMEKLSSSDLLDTSAPYARVSIRPEGGVSPPVYDRVSDARPSVRSTYDTVPPEQRR